MKQSLLKNVKQTTYIALSLLIALPHFVGGGTLIAELDTANYSTDETVITTNDIDDSGLELPTQVGGPLQRINIEEPNSEINTETSQTTDTSETEAVEEQEEGTTDETEIPEIVETAIPEAIETDIPMGDVAEEPVVSENKSMRSISTGKVGTVDWNFDTDTGVLTFSGGTFPDAYDWRTLIDPIPRSSVTKVVFTAPVTSGNTMRYMFYNMTSLTEIVNFNLLNTSNVTNMTQTFTNCTSLKSIDFSGFNTSKVVQFENFLSYCQSLTELDLSSFDTSSATTIKGMFYECRNLESVDVSSFNTSKITDLSTLFWENRKLKSLDLSSFDTSNVTNLYAMFINCQSLESIELSNWNVSKVKNMAHLFSGCSVLTDFDVSKWDTSSVTNLSFAFLRNYALETVDISNWDVSKVTDMSWMFLQCDNLKYLDLTKWDVSSCTTLYLTFADCISLTSLDLSNWNTMNLTNMNAVFDGSTNLSDLDISRWNTSKVTSMRNTFTDCISLTKLDLSGWDTSNVTDMTYMFYGCTNLADLNVSTWDTSKVTTMKYAFTYLKKLVKLDLTNWDNSQASSDYMFSSSNIREFTLGPKFVMNSILKLNKPYTSNGFDGTWEYVPTKTSVTVDEIEAYGNAGSTLTAGKYIWKNVQYKINFNMNFEGGAETAPASQMYDYYSFITKPADPVRPGYTFNRWTTDVEGKFVVNFSTYRMPGKEVTIYAQWTPISYSVKFIDHDGREIFNQNMNYGTEISAPATPVRTGYTFTGWTPAVDATVPANDVTYTATYAINQYNVLFNTFDGNEIERKTLDFGAEIIAPTAPERPGYTFTGWTPAVNATVPANDVTYTATYSANKDTPYKVEHYLEQLDGSNLLVETEDFTGTSDTGAMLSPKTYAGYTFKPGSTNSGVIAANGSLVLKAYYKLNTYSVTFNKHNGDEISTTSLKFGANITAPTAPERTGYTFTGWTPALAETMPANNVTYTAEYTANTDIAYKVEHYQEQLDGTYVCVETENLTGTTDTEVEATIKTFEGYTFDAANASNVAIGTVAADGSLVLKTYYTLNTYKVTFNDRDGKEISTVNLKFGEKITAPAYPFITGYSFTGWAPKLATTMPASDVTYTATYGANQYTLTFKDYDGRYITGGIYSFGTPIFAPASPTREGYTFKDWHPKVATTMTAYGVTHVAQYTANTDTAYKVEHYQEQLDGSYVLVETENLTGTTDTTVDATIMSFEGYTFDAGHANNVASGIVASNGSLVLKSYYALNTYTVSFNDHNGDEITSNYLKYSAEIIAPTNPERLGYTFTGWTPAVDATMPAHSVTYTATYSINQYTVTFNNFDGTEITSETLDFGAEINTPADPERVGYTFTGWTPAVDATMPANNVTYTATYSINQYTVTFNNFDGTEITTDTLDFGAEINTPADPERVGYTFTGWTPAVAETMPANDVTYTATYSINQYTVTFNNFDGTEITTETLDFGAEINTPTDPERVGYTFTGWTPAVDATMPANNVTYTATYSINQYTVTFNNFDGTEITSDTLDFGATINTPTDPERVGYTFTGWTPAVDATMPANHVTYTATYSINQYTVTFNNFDGTEITTDTLDFGATITAPTDPERVGFTFTGWTPAVAETMPANNVTYTATYSINQYTVTFNNFDGTEITTDTLNFGAEINTPTDPERVGYTFTGWTPAVDATMPANNVTYTATYSINQYTVTFNNFDGTEITSETLDFGAGITAPTDPERVGFTFTGWTPAVAETMPANDVTYTAEYSANTDTAYKVDYYVEKLDGTFEVKETENLTGTTDTNVEATIKAFEGYTQDAANANSVTTGTVAADGSLVLKVYYTLNTYTVSFNDHNGDEITTADLKFGAVIETLADPERTGYTFTGWTPAVDATMPANNVTYTATYSINQYTVTFNNFDGTEITTDTLDFGATITAPTDPERVGYTFTGWTPAVDATMPANNVTYTATYSINQYTVTFNNFDGTEITSETLDFGAGITAPTDPERVGFTFTGWTPAVAETMPANNVTYTATYSINQYTVTFNNFDGTEITSDTLDFGATINTPTDPERVGYTFTGWTPAVDATMPANNVTYTATYSINQYTVTFNNFDGTEITSETLDFGAGITAPTDPERVGYTYTGWTPAVDETMPANNVTYTAEYSANTDTAYKVEYYQEQLDGTYTVYETVELQGTTGTSVDVTLNTYEGFTYSENDPMNKTNGIIEGNGTLVLKVFYIRNVYNVTFRDFDNKIVKSDDLKFGAPIVVPANPSRSAFTFDGWTPAVEATMPARDLRYAATYTAAAAAPFVVEHHLETVDGVFEVAEVVEKEAPIHTTVRAIVREYPGYTYDKRNPNANLAGPVIEDGSLVLKAYYKLNSYKVTFNDFEGNAITAQDQAYGTEIIAPEAPERVGYTFTGWTPAVDATVPENDVTYTAMYTANTDITYKVEYYTEKLDGTFEVKETENLTGTMDTEVEATIKTFVGYTHDATNADSVTTGTVTADGNLVLKVYYLRNTYTVTYKDHDETVIAEFTGKYEEPYKIPAVPTRPAYQFTDWIEIQNTRTVNQRAVQGLIPSRDVVYTARYAPIEEAKPVKPLTDDGGPFTTDECGTITDRWGNVMYKPSTCLASTAYKVPNTGIK